MADLRVSSAPSAPPAHAPERPHVSAAQAAFFAAALRPQGAAAQVSAAAPGAVPAPVRTLAASPAQASPVPSASTAGGPLAGAPGASASGRLARPGSLIDIKV